jgi:hypothetical protein
VAEEALTAEEEVGVGVTQLTEEVGMAYHSFYTKILA